MSLLSVKLDREQIKRNGFYTFAKRAWPVVESAPLQDGWYLKETCNALQAVTQGRIKDMVINMPPGTAKSTIVSVLWPAWSWLEKPFWRFIFGSYDPGLAYRDAEKMFKLVASPWYVQRWGTFFTGNISSFKIGEFYNRFGGMRYSTSVGSSGTGRHGHVRAVDDPNKAADAEGGSRAVSAALEKSNVWWRGTMGARTVDWRNFISLVSMQRLHENDLSQQCLAEDGYKHWCLPLEFEPERACILLDDQGELVARDQRTQQNEVLHPARFDAEAVLRLKKRLGELNYAGQAQQRPAPKGGLLFKRESFQYFRLADMPLSATFSCLSIDCTFKDQSTNDFVALEILGKKAAQFFVYDSVLEHADLENTIRLALQMLKKWERINAVLVEGKANGPEVIKALRKVLPNVLEINPKSSKYERAQATNIYYQAGSVFHLEGASWLDRKELNLEQFPKGRNDDDVDSTTQGLLWLDESSSVDFSSAMSRFKQELQAGAFSRHYSVI